MFSHVTLGTDDPERAVAFYDALLAPLGIVRLMFAPEVGLAGYGPRGGDPRLFVMRPFDRRAASGGNGSRSPPSTRS